jgi:two-component system chemotaxis sensor kinase CheA
MIPVIYIGEILDVAHDDGGGRYAIVVGYDERRIGLLIDEMFGQNEIVIKSLGDYFAGLRGFAGASEVGKHEIVLVMDTEAIIDSALIRHKEGPHV